MYFLNLIYVFVYLSSGNLLAAYWEIAAHSAYDMFFKYKYIVLNCLVFSPPRFFGVGVSFRLRLFLIIACFYLS